MATKSSRFSFGWIFLILLLAAGGGAYWWFQQRADNKPLEFRTVKVAKGEIVQSVTASGQVTPLLNVQVGSQVSGIITNIYADFNSVVTKGQLLAELDRSTFLATVNQSQGNLANAEASLTLAQVNAKRSEELIGKNLIAPSDYDKAKADLKVAEAQVQIRKAQLMKDNIDLSRASIYSPIDGVVISRNMDIGQTLAASFNAPVLFQIANDLAKMQIQAMVSEADIGGVEVDQEVNFTVDAFPARTFKGRVEQVRFSPTTNQSVVTYATVIEVPNKDKKLRPGMTANVSIITAKQQDILKVANSALRYRPGEGVPVKTAATTNAGPAAPASGSTASAGASDGPALDQMPEEIRQRVLSRYDKNGDGKLDAEETKAWKEGMAARRAAGGGGGGGGRGGFGGGGSSSNVPQSRTVYRVEMVDGPGGQKTQMLVPLELKLGITDGSATEIKDGLKEGDEVVIGLLNPPPSSTAPGGSTANRPNRPVGGGRPGMRPRSPQHAQWTANDTPKQPDLIHAADHPTDGRPQDLQQRRPEGARRPRRHPHGGAGRVRGGDGSQRIGKIDLDEHPRLPRPAERRTLPAG